MTLADDQLEIVQIGMSSADIVGSARLFTELFGFHNAGGHMIWGDPMRMQGLESSARGLMWWLVGRQKFVQLELFQHTAPMQRPLPADWRCCDLGWTRFGVAVPDLDAVRATLGKWGIGITGESSGPAEASRLAFRDPFVGCFIEVFADGDTIPGGRRAGHFDLDPAIIYATSSVSNLAAARNFYGEVLGFEIGEEIEIHQSKHDDFWGLQGAASDSFVVRGKGILLEIVQYLDPVGRPKAVDYRISDQGILNVALAARSRGVVENAIERVRESGCRTTPLSVFGEACGAYVLEPEREIELSCLPESLDAAYGFIPSAPFVGV